jgi:presenilin-like A22 family membrane protease
MVILTMSTPAARRAAGVRIIHPNRSKPVVQATRATVIVLLLVTAGLMLLITIGGFEALEGIGPVVVQCLFVVWYLLLAFYAGRWNRGVLPVASVLAVLLGTFALIAAPSWFERDSSAFAQPALASNLLGVLTLLLIPVQILLVVFAMRGFSQGWNVELEQRDPAAPVGGYGDAAPHPA